MSVLDETIQRHENDARLSSDVPTSWGRYSGYRELLEGFALREREGARVSIAGRSIGGEPIVRFELGPETRAGSALVLGGIHAMEWIGVESALAIIDAAIAERPSRRVVVYPLLNPDGYRVAEANLRARRFRFVRANANGVDLNRNWHTDWRPRKPFYQRIFTFLGTPGAEPSSEPEIAAVTRELDASRGDFVRGTSLHSFGGMLLLPYGGRFGRPPDYDTLHAHARGVNERLGGRYTIRSSSAWVPGQFAHGMELDDLHARGISPILVECAWGQLSLWKPSTWLHPWRWFNPVDPEVHATRIASALRPFLLDER